MGTTASQRKLFFSLRKTKVRLCAFEEGDPKPENVAAIVTCLGVNSKDVIDMNAVWALTLRSTRCCVKRAKTVENGRTGSSTAAWIRNASS